jgi:iron complex outermembrane receptor protein
MQFSSLHSLAKAGLRAGTALAITTTMLPAMAMAQDAGEQAAADREIVVTGTLIRGQAPVGANQIDISAARIEETASTSANQLLASIPQVTNYFNAVPSADLAIAANQIQISRPPASTRPRSIPT